jgi:hypothetical protein
VGLRLVNAYRRRKLQVLASLLPVGWRQTALAVRCRRAVERLFRTYFASLTLSLIHVIARVAAGSPKVLIASTAT